LQVAPRQILQDQVVKYGSVQVSGSPVTKTTDYVGMAYAIESDSFVLKVLYKRSFQIRIYFVLEEDV
jgi:hypothetical protein